MQSRPFIAVILGMAAWLPLAGGSGNLDAFQELLSHSPFGSAEMGASAAAAANAPIEFRGVLEENGSRFFSIFNPANHRSAWVELNIPTNGYFVKAYDEKTLCVSVEYQGRLLTLLLKRGRVVAQTPSIAPALAPSDKTAAAVNSRFDPIALKQKQEESRRRRQQMAAQTARP